MNRLLSLMLAIAPLVGARAQCPWDSDNSLQQPLLTLGGPYILECPGDSLQFAVHADGEIASFSWSGPNGFSSNLQNPEVTDPGSYTLTVNYGGGCVEGKSVNVTDNVASRPNIEVQGATIDCRSSSVRLRVTTDDPLSTFSWTGPPGFAGSTSPNPLTSIPGTYQVAVVDANQCNYRFSAAVLIDTVVPGVIVDDVLAQSCDQTSFQLAPSGVSIANQTPLFNWAGPQGYRSAERAPTTNMVGAYRLTVTDPVNRCSSFDIMRVVPHPDQPTIQLKPADLGCDAPTDSMIVSVSNCDDCMIAWSGPGGFTSDELAFEVGMPSVGVYSVAATEPASGCTNQLSVNITPDTVPLTRVFRDPPRPVTCDLPGEARLFLPHHYEQITFVDARTGMSFDGDRISLDQPGMVYVESIDIHGCLQLDTFNIERREDPDLVLNIEDDTLTCLGEPVTVGVSSSNYSLSEFAELTWTFADGSTASGAIVPVTAQGPFSIQARAANGCLATIDSFVPIDFRQPQVTAFGGYFDCTQAGIQLTSESSDHGILQTIWSGPRNFWTTETSPTVSSAGIYTVEVTAANGCTSTDTAQVSSQLQTLDSMVLMVTDINCAGDGQVVIANFDPAVSYSWKPVDSSSSTVFADDRGLFVQPGDYVIEGLHLPTSCLLIDSISIAVDTVLPTVSLSTIDTLRCATSEVSITSNVDVPVLYVWSTIDGLIVNDNEGPDLLAGRQGTYRLTATSLENQCSQSAEIELAEIPSDLTDYMVVTQSPNCQGDHDGRIDVLSVTGGTPPYLYSLGGDHFGTQSSFQNLEEGEYHLIIEDANGCSLDTNLILDRVPTFEVDLGGDLRIRLGQAIELEARVDLPVDQIDSYSWNFSLGDSCQGNCPIRMFSPIESSFYIVSVQSLDGCTMRDTAFVQVVDAQGIFVPNAITPNGDGINDFAEVHIGPAIASLEVFEVYDRWGNRVFAASDFNAGDATARWDGTSGGESLRPGVYVYLLRATDIRGDVRDLMGEITLVR